MKKEEFTIIRNLTIMLFASFIILGLIFAIYIGFTFINKSDTSATITQKQIDTDNSIANIEVDK